jgi:tRNA(His) 5'-end guanylyltransferase
MANKKDSLGDRMKTYYEDRTRIFLPRRTYTIIRIDGKSFSHYCKGLIKPFDQKFIDDMDETAIYLCGAIQGTKLAFVQSDEISLVLTDFDGIATSAWFDANIQKMASISASLATAKFNQLRPDKVALFDSRVFTIPSAIEVENYLIWRQMDTTRNSISSVARAMFSHRELENKNTNMMQEMCFQKGVNWNDYPVKLKRGRLIIKEEYEKNGAFRTRWISTESPIFTQDREVLEKLIPKLN